METITETPEQRVARGAALLDERVPGWRANIDTDRLDMTDGSQCVLGQLAPMITGGQWDSYGDAVTALFSRPVEGYGGRRLTIQEAEYGFLSLNDDSSDYSSDWGPSLDLDATDALTPLWIEEINRGA